MPEHRRAAREHAGAVRDEQGATSAGTNPFRTSSSITGRPYQRPYTRQTLVAPMLPLPTVRMSTPFVRRTSQYPNGQEPAR